MTPNRAGALSEVVAEMRETAKEYRVEDRSVGIFPDHEAADMLSDWADRLESLSRAGDGPVAHEAKAASIETACREVFVPCDCGCGRSCCAMCGSDCGFVQYSAHPQAAAQGVTEAVIGAAFLSVLGDPSVSWRDCAGAKGFIDRVASEAGALCECEPGSCHGQERDLRCRYKRSPITAALEARVPEGWRLVPVEPTPEMCRAGGFHEWSGGFDRNGSHNAGEYQEYTHSMEGAFGTYGCEGAAHEVYAAMLAATPQVPK